MFLRQRGLQVHHANGLEVLPTLKPEQHSLLLLGERSNMTPQQVEHLLDWAWPAGACCSSPKRCGTKRPDAVATCCSIACTCASFSARTSKPRRPAPAKSLTRN